MLTFYIIWFISFIYIYGAVIYFEIETLYTKELGFKLLFFLILLWLPAVIIEISLKIKNIIDILKSRYRTRHTH